MNFSRPRQSAAQPTPARSGRALAAARQSTQATPHGVPSTTELPAYQAPEFSLNPAAQRKLANLARSHDLSKLERRFGAAQTLLQQSAVDVNEQLRDRTNRTANVRKKREQARDLEGGDEEDDDTMAELERKLATLREKVDSVTARTEEQVRKTVDGKLNVLMMKDSVIATAEHARNHASTQASIQNVRSQRTRRTQGDDGEEAEGSDGDEDEAPDWQPTDPAGAGTQPGSPPVEVFREELDNRKTRYQTKSLAERYASNEEYVDFRRLVHDAQYPDDEVPMPPPEEWFNHDGSIPPPGTTARPRADADDDSDEDLAISRSTVSTKCPLTLVEMREPYSSKKCQHTFEKASILEFMRGKREVQCPGSGCTQSLTANDLHVDKIIVRKIKRLQKAKEMQQQAGSDDEDEDVDGTQHNAHVIGSDNDGIEDDYDAPATRVKTQPKTEPRPTGASAMPGPSQPPGSSHPPGSTQVIDLWDSDEDADHSIDD